MALTETRRSSYKNVPFLSYWKGLEVIVYN